jgi:hypothetical protein
MNRTRAMARMTVRTSPARSSQATAAAACTCSLAQRCSLEGAEVVATGCGEG